MYQQLLDMLNSMKPVDLVTGKRVYKNMLLFKVGVQNDVTTENQLIADLSFTEVLITETQAIHCADKTEMQEGVNTSAVKQGGIVAGKKVPAEQLPSAPLLSGGTP